MTRERITALLAAARRIADPTDPLGQRARAELLTTSGLSAEGIELALTTHLETTPTAHDLDTLLSRATRAPHCAVILAANVCTAPLRALALALATAPRVTIRPSRRDPTLTDLLLTTLALPTLTRDGAHPRVGEVVVQNSPGTSPRARGTAHEFEENDENVTLPALAAGDELHVYGSDATIADIRKKLPPSVTLRGHGTGIGVALVSDDDAGAAAAAIAADLVPFDGRGCLSPRLVLVDGDAVAFGRELHLALERAGAVVPRGVLSSDERASLARYRETMRAVGQHFEGPHHAVAVDPEPAAIALPPAHRAAIVVPAEAQRLVDAALVTAIGGAGDDHPLVLRCPRARRSALGRMQRPPLDGPVDLRNALETEAC